MPHEEKFKSLTFLYSFEKCEGAGVVVLFRAHIFVFLKFYVVLFLAPAPTLSIRNCFSSTFHFP